MLTVTRIHVYGVHRHIRFQHIQEHPHPELEHPSALRLN
jgi:hypothetical protein